MSMPTGRVQVASFPSRVAEVAVTPKSLLEFAHSSLNSPGVSRSRAAGPRCAGTDAALAGAGVSGDGTREPTLPSGPGDGAETQATRARGDQTWGNPDGPASGPRKPAVRARGRGRRPWPVRGLAPRGFF